MAAKTSWHRYATNYVTVILCIAVNITKRVTSVARGRICATHAMCRCMRTAARSMHTLHTHTHTHTHTQRLTALFSRTTQVSGYQKGKTNLDFTEARDSEWQWHQLGICKSAPRSRQITTPATHHSVFTGRMPFLPPNQQRQNTEGTTTTTTAARSMCAHNINGTRGRRRD